LKQQAQRWVAVSLLLLVAAAIALAQQPAWLAAFQEAVRALRSNQTTAAEAQLNNLKVRYPGDPQLLTSVGAALDANGKHHEATAWYQQALSASPGYAPAVNDLALNYLAQGMLAQAVPLLERVVKANPANPQSLYNLGLAQLKLKHYKQAVDTFRQMGQIAVAPEAKEQIGVAEATALINLKEYREAIGVLSQTADTAGIEHLLLLGSAEALGGDLPSAIQTLQSAAKRFPSEPAPYYRLALVLSLGGRNQDAQEALAAGFKAVPDSALLWYGQAVIDDAIGLYEDAAKAAQTSLKLRPAQADAWGLLGNVDVRLARMDDAVEAFQKALSLGADVHVRVNFGECLIRLGRFGDAGRLFAKLEREAPENAEVNRGIGKLYRAQGEFAKAEPALRHAVALDPGDSEAHFALAETLRHLGRLEAAKQEYAAFERTKTASHMVRLLEAS
jgi:tetratricopeptide (TPR) repeat protein